MSIKFVAGEKNEPFFVPLVLKLGKEPKSVWGFTLPSFWRKIYLQEWKSPTAVCSTMKHIRPKTAPRRFHVASVEVSNGIM